MDSTISPMDHEYIVSRISARITANIYIVIQNVINGNRPCGLLFCSARCADPFSNLYHRFACNVHGYAMHKCLPLTLVQELQFDNFAMVTGVSIHKSVYALRFSFILV